MSDDQILGFLLFMLLLFIIWLGIHLYRWKEKEGVILPKQKQVRSVGPIKIKYDTKRKKVKGHYPVIDDSTTNKHLNPGPTAKGGSGESGGSGEGT